MRTRQDTVRDGARFLVRELLREPVKEAVREALREEAVAVQSRSADRAERTTRTASGSDRSEESSAGRSMVSKLMIVVGLVTAVAAMRYVRNRGRTDSAQYASERPAGGYDTDVTSGPGESVGAEGTGSSATE